MFFRILVDKMNNSKEDAIARRTRNRVQQALVDQVGEYDIASSLFQALEAKGEFSLVKTLFQQLVKNVARLKKDQVSRSPVQQPRQQQPREEAQDRKTAAVSKWLLYLSLYTSQAPPPAPSSPAPSLQAPTPNFVWPTIEAIKFHKEIVDTIMDLVDIATLPACEQMLLENIVQKLTDALNGAFVYSLRQLRRRNVLNYKLSHKQELCEQETCELKGDGNKNEMELDMELDDEDEDEDDDEDEDEDEDEEDEDDKNCIPLSEFADHDLLLFFIKNMTALECAIPDVAMSILVLCDTNDDTRITDALLDSQPLADMTLAAHCASEYKLTSVVARILQHHIKNKDKIKTEQRTRAQLAHTLVSLCAYAPIAYIELALDAGANVNATDTSMTAIEMARGRENEEEATTIIKLLQERGAAQDQAPPKFAGTKTDTDGCSIRSLTDLGQLKIGTTWA